MWEYTVELCPNFGRQILGTKIETVKVYNPKGSNNHEYRDENGDQFECIKRDAIIDAVNAYQADLKERSEKQNFLKWKRQIV